MFRKTIFKIKKYLYCFIATFFQCLPNRLKVRKCVNFLISLIWFFFKLKNSSSSAFFGKNFCWQGECLSFWAYGATSYFIFVEFAKTDKIDPPYFKVYHLLCSVHLFPPTQPKEISFVRVLQPPFEVLNCSTCTITCTK